MVEWSFSNGHEELLGQSEGRDADAAMCVAWRPSLQTRTTEAANGSKSSLREERLLALLGASLIATRPRSHERVR